MASRLFGEGAEARLYTASVFGRSIAVKSREPKAYRVMELDLRLRAQRTRSEARLMQRALSLGVRVPRLIALGRFSIYMERLDGRLLKDARITVRHATQIGRALARLHNGNVVHGDFTPANIMEFGKELYIIDFGLAESSGRLEDKAIDVLLMKKALSKDVYPAFARAYASDSREGKAVMGRLAEMEKRGRYQVRTLT